MSLVNTIVNPAVFVVMAISAAGASAAPADAGLIAHEWGTFTSVAGEDGSAVQWAPLFGAPDLPCFVNRLGPFNTKFAPGLVRMETPVLYFYAPDKETLSVHVHFPHGWITEWYPQATRVSPETSQNASYEPFMHGKIDWDGVQVSTGASLPFPSSQGSSRYYAARNTDSAPLRIGDDNEKFIFYRGIADFSIPLEPRFTNDGKLELRNSGTAPIPFAIVFENRDGNVGYRFRPDIKSSATIDPPELTGNLTNLREQLAKSLIDSGLYRKEALAMIDTWQDSWFEEGMRVLYIVPRSFVNAQLPLSIKPRPAEVKRVFVGRIEVLSPEAEEAIHTGLVNGDTATLAKFGRFLDAFMQQIEKHDSNLVESPAARRYFDQAYAEIWQKFNAKSCVQ